MRISGWSAAVCSSDLREAVEPAVRGPEGGIEAAEVVPQQRVLVGRAGARREAAVDLDGGVEAERLDEHRPSAGPQHAGDLREGAVDVQVLDDAAAEHQVKAVVRKRPRLGVHRLQADVGEALLTRSDELRCGKEWVRTCYFWRSQNHHK